MKKFYLHHYAFFVNLILLWNSLFMHLKVQYIKIHHKIVEIFSIPSENWTGEKLIW